MQSLNSEILKSLLDNKAVVEVTIIEQNGSTPRTAGTKMLVFEDASIKGTIGGGLYEAKAIEHAVKVLNNKENNIELKENILFFDMQTKTNPTDMDMICGGAIRLLVDNISPTKENISFYTSLCAIEDKGQSAFLVSQLVFQNKIEKNQVIINKALISADKESVMIHSEIIPQELLSLLEENKDIANYFKDNEEYCIECIKKAYSLYIFGAGHVSLELAKVAEYLDFKTIVIDDRNEFCNKERFDKSETVVLPSLNKEQVSQYISKLDIGAKEGIIIVTRGHARDREVLECSLKTKAGYIGMIGSKTKRKATYENLIASGYNQNDFDRIFSPIGLTIGAQSPEEIAISICAQLIQFRAGKLELSQ